MVVAMSNTPSPGAFPPLEMQDVSNADSPTKRAMLAY